MARSGALEGRCVSRGFLGKFGESVEPSGIRRTREIFEVDKEDRDRPERISAFVGSHREGRITSGLVCSRAAFGLLEETKAADFQAVPGLPTRTVLQRDRNCPKWDRYVSGLSPHEHLMEFKFRELERVKRRDRRISIAVGAVAVLVSAVISSSKGSLTYNFVRPILRWLGAESP